MKQFQRFLIVGALGFVVDFSVLYLALHVAALGLLAGRVLSFLVAATVTWKANRHFTFATAQPVQDSAAWQWLRYLATTALGGAVNIGVYRLWLGAFGAGTLHLFLAVVAGSAVALLINFTLSKRMVFAR